MQFTKDQVELANSMRPNTLVDHLDISFGLSQQGQLTASMPVDHRTHQSMGLLHGGATAALAETLGSMGSALLLDLERWAIVGMEVSAEPPARCSGRTGDCHRRIGASRPNHPCVGYSSSQ